jgi:hypothetical protein
MCVAEAPTAGRCEASARGLPQEPPRLLFPSSVQESLEFPRASGARDRRFKSDHADFDDAFSGSPSGDDGNQHSSVAETASALGRTRLCSSTHDWNRDHRKGAYRSNSYDSPSDSYSIRMPVHVGWHDFIIRQGTSTGLIKNKVEIWIVFLVTENRARGQSARIATGTIQPEPRDNSNPIRQLNNSLT